ncbi:DUF7681 family protein [Amycolatopsis taiwanensis]|uniref:Acb2/Tad1 domain-containing protein n=1 Tax=Amycolatopsis taiwanensis TaxID=342230 RepID=UPI0004AF0A41|nr:hypothetical protein [Amycolatopsis taiwanensis]
MTDEKIDTGSQNVSGYRKQTPEALSVVNRVKNFENRTAEFIRWYLGEGVPLDPRQLASARTHFEYAFYHLNRAVFQPADPIGDAISQRQNAGA